MASLDKIWESALVSILLEFLTEGRRPNGFLGLSLNDGTFLFPVILFDKAVSVG